MGKIILYGILASPPVRAVLLTLKALEVPYTFQEVNLAAGEHLSEEYLKKNPQHTVPVLEDDGHFLWDSHAIIAYLASKYGKNDALYPKDLLQRAVVDQRLHFDSGVLFTAMRNISYPLLRMNQLEVAQSKIDAVHQTYEFMEKFLSVYKFAAADHLTIADFSILATITGCDMLAPIDPEVYPKITAWMSNLKKLPYYEEANGKGLEAYRALLFKNNWKIVP